MLGYRLPLIYRYRKWKGFNIVNKRTVFKHFLEKERAKLESVNKYTILKTVNAPPSKVYEVVSEVSRYNEFIPYCLDSFIDKRDLVTGRPTLAGLRIGFKQYDERVTCNVNCQEIKDKEYYIVEAKCISHDLFKTFYSKWSIIPHPRKENISQVELVLKFQFHSLLYNSVSTIFANNLTSLAMGAFAQRSIDLHEKGKFQ